MTKLDKRLLGRYQWYWKQSPDAFTSSHGMEAVWKDPDATLEQLKAANDHYDNRGGYFYLEQWQPAKEGRRTFAKRVTIKELNR